MKRFVLWALVLAALLIIVAPAQAQSGEVILQLTVTEFLEENFRAVADQFEAENPGIRVQLVTIPGFGLGLGSSDAETYLDDWQEYASSADVLTVDSSISVLATRAGFLLDLTPLVSSDPSFNEADWHQAMLDSFEWDGGLWALPVSGNIIVLTYIPSAFDEAGVGYPNAGWTVDDLANAARALAEFNSDGSLAMPGLLALGNNNLTALFLSLLGQGVYDESTFPSMPNFDNPQIEALLTTWQELQADGVLDFPQGEEFDPTQVPMQLGSGFGVRIRFSSNSESEVAQNTAVLLPGGRAGLDVNGYAISSGTQYPEESYRLVQFLTNHPNVVNSTFGSVSARKVITGSEAEIEGGGPGGFRLAVGAAVVAPEIQAILDEALANAIPLSMTRFADGLTSALNKMTSESLDARAALDAVETELLAGLDLADTRAETTRITVNLPVTAAPLAPGEIAINFAATGFVSPFPNEDKWLAAIDEFVANDSEVGAVNLETVFRGGGNLTELASNYDCFYTPNNQVPDADLSLLRSLDPLIAADPNFDASDFVAGVLSQVQRDNMTWGIPLTVMPQVMRFNYDWFNQAGVPAPQGTWTVSEFEDALRNLQAVLPDDVVPFQPSDSGYLLTLIAAYGGLPLDPRTDPPTVNFTDSAVIGAIQQVLDLAKADYFTYQEQVGGAGGAIVMRLGAEEDRPLYTETLGGFGPGGAAFVFVQGGAPALPENTDGLVTFPRGTQYNVVPLDLGAAYISANTLYTEACYRLIQHLSNSPDLFQSMPARRSQFSDPDVVSAQGEARTAFYAELDRMMQEPNTLVLPTSVAGRGNFLLTYWLYSVFDRYVADQVTDLEAELRQAQTYTQEYLACAAAIPPINIGVSAPQEVFQQMIECATRVDPNASSFFGG